VLKDHLEQLAKVGYLKEFVMDPKNQEIGGRMASRESPPTPIGSDRSHPCSSKRHPEVKEKGCTDCSIGGEWHG